MTKTDDELTGGHFNGLGLKVNRAYAELILLFDTDDLTDVVGQLGQAFDDFSVAGSVKHAPSMVIVRKTVWLKIEKELNNIINKQKTKNQIKQYDRVNEKPGIHQPPEHGYNALIFRARPIVPIDGQNIIADRVGANK